MTRDPIDRILEAAAVADAARREMRADLRAKVEAMDSPLSDAGHRARWVQRADVLALLDGDTR